MGVSCGAPDGRRWHIRAVACVGEGGSVWTRQCACLRPPETVGTPFRVRLTVLFGMHRIYWGGEIIPNGWWLGSFESHGMTTYSDDNFAADFGVANPVQT